MNEEETLWPSTVVSLIDALSGNLERMKKIQKNAGRSEGARALACSITKLEEAIMWVGKIGSHGYEV